MKNYTLNEKMKFISLNSLILFIVVVFSLYFSAVIITKFHVDEANCKELIDKTMRNVGFVCTWFNIADRSWPLALFSVYLLGIKNL